MRSERYRPVLYWLAVFTAAAALLPIVVGALVTTLDAGMAFSDWPASDGQGMLSYPWLKSAGDKFVEHGHRLAGIIIGCVSIVFAAATWRFESRRWVRWCGVGVLLAVIAQGLLGGGRVLADARLFALFHGAFAAAVFAFMSSVALILSRSWVKPPGIPDRMKTGGLKILAVVTPAVIVLQYSLGGLVRHLGSALSEHVGMAFAVLFCVAATVIAAQRTRCGWLKRPAYLMGGVALCQILLGAATWVLKFGFAPVGYVAVQRSLPQIVTRTSHTVVAMLLLMTSVILVLRVLRVEWLRRGISESAPRPAERAMAGGLATGSLRMSGLERRVS